MSYIRDKIRDLPENAELLKRNLTILVRRTESNKGVFLLNKTHVVCNRFVRNVPHSVEMKNITGMCLILSCCSFDVASQMNVKLNKNSSLFRILIAWENIDGTVIVV